MVRAPLVAAGATSAAVAVDSLGVDDASPDDANASEIAARAYVQQQAIHCCWLLLAMVVVVDWAFCSIADTEHTVANRDAAAEQRHDGQTALRDEHERTCTHHVE